MVVTIWEPDDGLFDRQDTQFTAYDGDTRCYFMLSLSGSRLPGWSHNHGLFSKVCSQVMNALDDVRGHHEVCSLCVKLWTQKVSLFWLNRDDACEGVLLGHMDRLPGQDRWHLRGGCRESPNPAGLSFSR